MHVSNFQVRNQDTLSVFSGISIEGREIGWAWLKVIEWVMLYQVYYNIDHYFPRTKIYIL